MRLTDSFIEVFLYARQAVRELGISTDSVHTLRDSFVVKFNEAEDHALGNGFDLEIIEAAKFPVVAYIDEMILCSSWDKRGEWQQESLQRHYFNTTNIGDEFYEKLNNLSKHGPDSWVRELYLLCMGLGFKGRYFSNDDYRKLEEIKGFNLQIFSPEESQRNLDTAVLFPSAYIRDEDSGGSFKQRRSYLLLIIGTPIVIVGGMLVYFQGQISATLTQISTLLA